MESAQFFAASRLVIVAGKGGVGKTTVTAAMARAAALTGLSSLIIEVEGKSGMAAMFGQNALDYDEIELSSGGGPEGAGEIRGRTVTPDDALYEYLRDHGLKRLSKRLMSSGLLDVAATAAPGIKDILVLGKIKQLERAESADVIFLDAPAAGHAITFLLAARALLDAVRVGPINSQAKDVLELLTDPARCQVVLVTLPEETPVNELVDTAYHLEDRVGVSLGPVVVNGLYRELAGLTADPVTAAAETGITLRSGEAEALTAAAEFRRQRGALQQEQLDRLAEQLPLPQLRLPFLFTTEVSPVELDVLAQALLEGIALLGGPAA